MTWTTPILHNRHESGGLYELDQLYLQCNSWLSSVILKEMIQLLLGKKEVDAHQWRNPNVFRILHHLEGRSIMFPPLPSHFCPALTLLPPCPCIPGSSPSSPLAWYSLGEQYTDHWVIDFVQSVLGVGHLPWLVGPWPPPLRHLYPPWCDLCCVSNILFIRSST